jgi:hypothetical protein
MDKCIYLIVIALLFCSFLNLSLAADETKEECSPSYECAPWGECSDGLRSRTCIDVECNRRDIVERTFCQDLECTPQIACDSWGPCTYTEKTDSLIQGKVSFGGYRSRVCRDSNKCIPSFIQEGSCEDSYQLKLSPIEECSEHLLAVIDPTSDRKIAKINLDSWKQNRLEIAFVQGNKIYCPSCFNAVKDDNEDGVDCGGSCKPCKVEHRALSYLAVLMLWSGSIVFSFLSFREVRSIRRPQTLFTDEQYAQ